MTANQINYAKLQEDTRSHRAQEALTKQMNAETQRSNLARENISKYSAEESVRHNQTMESLEKERNTLNYNASVYSSEVSRRNAELNYQSSIYSADQSRSATEYAANQNYGGTVLNVEQHDRERLTSSQTASDNRASTERIQTRAQNMNLIGTVINTFGNLASSGIGALGNVASTVIGRMLSPTKVR